MGAGLLPQILRVEYEGCIRIVTYFQPAQDGAFRSRPDEWKAEQRAHEWKRAPTSGMWLLLLARCLGLPTARLPTRLLVCSGRGSLLPNGGCACHAGWSGPACARRGCKRECSGHGICLDGLCSCDPAWYGDDCGRRPVPAVVECPHSCWGQGACDFATGRCHCLPGFGGDDCSDGLCPRGCSGHGTCVDGTQPAISAVRGFASNRTAGRSFLAGGCLCDSGRTGRDCSLLRCVDDCSGHGVCLNGTCSCERGYGGRTCAAPACPYPCLNGGACGGGGGCRCARGWGGSDCSAPLGSQAAARPAAVASPSASISVSHSLTHSRH